MKKRDANTTVNASNDSSNLENQIINYFEAQQNADPAELKNQAEHNYDCEKGYNNIIDEIADRNGKLSYRKHLFQIAASITIFLSIFSAGYYYYTTFLNKVPETVMLEKSAGNGKVIKITLSDGSKVWLNAGSKISFPKSFGKSKREISLFGEAYFEVEHEQHRPFIIHTGAIITQVLGTSFNINAYALNKNIKVTVLTGKVAVLVPEKDKRGTRTIVLPIVRTIILTMLIINIVIVA
ncbi:hypothetical protein AAKU52_003401 [Pedobacter sp. CG_S7]|uniref:FecR family protein n=1 Tax=Pedobacter sp. CG_S7 TaxID=3143930 RepID=UPI00339699EE